MYEQDVVDQGIDFTANGTLQCQYLESISTPITHPYDGKNPILSLMSLRSNDQQILKSIIEFIFHFFPPILHILFQPHM